VFKLMEMEDSFWIALARDDLAIFIAYSAITIMALIPIWIGSYRSLDQKATEQVTSNYAYTFPLIASGMLMGLYVLFTYFSKEYVNMLLTAYFLVIGIFAASASVRPYIFRLISGRKRDKPTYKFSFSLPFQSEPIQIKWSWVDIFALIVGTAIGVWYVMTKHWIANNLLGLAFSIQGVALISLGSFQIGCIMLSGLFLYDIFWVFGTDVMVTVAKSFDAPIKLLWPRNLLADPLQFSMLGLGDIVLPGIFIALMLRLDAKRAKTVAGKKVPRHSFNKPYFTFTFGGYVIGLITTIAVMHLFQAAQPALLYLVPFCIGSSLICGLLLGELPGLIHYSEEKREKKQVKTKKVKQKKTVVKRNEK